jgi:hypothetical protein
LLLISLTWSLIMRDRLLVKHFLERFLEHDLISSNADRHEVLSVVGGMLIAVSLFPSLLIAAWYQFNASTPPGLTSLRSLDDRFFFVSSSMLVMALLAVSQWDALALDVRDASVLGILPIPRAVIVRAKFLAVAILAAATLVACNALPTLFRLATVPKRLPIGFGGVLILTFAHGLVTFAAGAFGFLAIFGLREGLTAVLGQDRFRSISSGLQAALLIVLVSALLLLPASSMDVARKWLAGERTAAAVLPPLWFVGLNETLAGSVVDDLPRMRPGRFLVVRERDATSLYRSLWPLYRWLSRMALGALTIVTCVTIAACTWNSRHLPTSGARRRRRTFALAPATQWIVRAVLGTSSLRQAGLWFTLQTLPRRLNHRAALASSLGVGLALVIVTVREGMVMVQPDIRTAPVAILAAQSLLLASVLTGFRHATQVPSDLRASRSFSLAWAGDLRAYLSGVKCAAFVGLVLPLLTVLSIWHVTLFGVRIAALHLGMGVAFSILLIELLFLWHRRVPFVSAYIPSVELKSQAVLYVITMLCVSFALASIERSALTAISRYMVLIGIAIGISVAVAVVDRFWDNGPVDIDLEEEPPLPTQRLGLST